MSQVLQYETVKAVREGEWKEQRVYGNVRMNLQNTIGKEYTLSMV